MENVHDAIMSLLIEVAATSSGVLLRYFDRRLFGDRNPGHCVAIDDVNCCDVIQIVTVQATSGFGWRSAAD